MVRYDDTSRILWIEGATPDAAWEIFRANPIEIDPGTIRAIAYYDPMKSDQTGMISNRSIIASFFTKSPSWTEVSQPKKTVHILPFSLATGKFQFCLNSPPLRMWSTEMLPGESPEHAAVHYVEELVNTSLSPDDMLLGITSTVIDDHTHFYFLLSVTQEFSSESGVWIARDKFDDWKWEEQTLMIRDHDTVRKVTERTIYDDIVEKMIS